MLGGAQTLAILFLGAERSRRIALTVFPLLILLGVLTWRGIPTILALIACSLIMFGRMQRNTLRLRQVQLLAAPVGMAHDLCVGALPALIGALTSALIAALALRRELAALSDPNVEEIMSIVPARVPSGLDPEPRIGTGG